MFQKELSECEILVLEVGLFCFLVFFFSLPSNSITVLVFLYIFFSVILDKGEKKM